MKYVKIKIMLFAILASALIFFGNDFAYIDIEKTAIITAIGVDVEQSGEYLVTAQIAVPEDTAAGEGNRHVEIEGRGATVGAAIKEIGDSTGWYPHLSFCNIVILGRDALNRNVIKILDYFAQTLRIQGSAMAVVADGKAKDILTSLTPLDKTSAFALQKVLFKNPGFDSDVASIAVKTFCKMYYDVTSSGYMPVISMIESIGSDSGSGSGKDSGIGGEQNSGQSGGGDKQSSGSSSGQSSGGGSSSGQSNKEKVFLADKTIIFKNGMPVGELSPFQTLVFNSLRENISGTTLQLKDIEIDGNVQNVLLTVIKNKPSIKVNVGNQGLTADINLKLYCKISDKDSEKSDASYSKNNPIPHSVIEAAQQKISAGIAQLVNESKLTDCDFLGILQQVYRRHFKDYEKIKNNFASALQEQIKVTVCGQK